MNHRYYTKHHKHDQMLKIYDNTILTTNKIIIKIICKDFSAASKYYGIGIVKDWLQSDFYIGKCIGTFGWHFVFETSFQMDPILPPHTQSS